MKLTQHYLIASLLLTVTAPLFAASITPTPEPGLWNSDSTTMINGVDMLKKMRDARDAMLANMPAEQRAMIGQMMDDVEIAGEQRCITSALAKQMTDPDTLLADAQQQMPGCELKVTQNADDRLEFNGECVNTDGFTGTMQGDVQMVSSREMRSNFMGDGTYKVSEHLTGGLSEELNGPVKIEHSETSKWVASDCGDVPVESLY
ncbi:MAG: DUF3617 family protein [Halopseudomonas sabulinigri]